MNAYAQEALLGRFDPVLSSKQEEAHKQAQEVANSIARVAQVRATKRNAKMMKNITQEKKERIWRGWDANPFGT
jgi:hypothetical protein